MVYRSIEVSAPGALLKNRVGDTRTTPPITYYGLDTKYIKMCK